MALINEEKKILLPQRWFCLLHENNLQMGFSNLVKSLLQLWINMKGGQINLFSVLS